MLWDDDERKFAPHEAATKESDACLQGLTITPREVIERINAAKGKGGRLDLAGLGLSVVPPEVWTLRDLVDLQLSNNKLTELHEDIGCLVELERLGVAGNRLRTFPDSVGKMRCLESVYAHGNLLSSLPASLLADCTELRHLMLGGNRLTSLPDTLGECARLEELSAPGNLLASLPESIGSATMLRVVDLHGNFIASLPESIGALRGCEEISVQGNALTRLPESMCDMRRLRTLNAAENDLEALPEKIGNAAMLTTLTLYGNPRLSALPLSLAKNVSLKQVWAEGCRLDGEPLKELIEAMEAPGGGRKNGPARLGVDVDAIAAAGMRTRQSRANGGGIACDHAHVVVSEVINPGPGEGQRRGYWKRVRWSEDRLAPVLVVAFGSAPGVPNWGGLLKKLKTDLATRGENNVGGAGAKAAAAVAHANAGFDVLYVADTSRSWYGGGVDAAGFRGDAEREWRDALSSVAGEYARVIHLGDSMGASAALLFSDVADAAIAFCPQVDLVSASIRPGRSAAWMRRHKASLTRAVSRATRERGASVRIHSGTWEHDLAQARMVPDAIGEEDAGGGGSVEVVKHLVDSHRLALALEEAEELLPIVRDELRTQMFAAGVGADRGGGGAEEDGVSGVDAIAMKSFKPGISLR